MATVSLFDIATKATTEAAAFQNLLAGAPCRRKYVHVIESYTSYSGRSMLMYCRVVTVSGHRLFSPYLDEKNSSSYSPYYYSANAQKTNVVSMYSCTLSISASSLFFSLDLPSNDHDNHDPSFHNFRASKSVDWHFRAA